MGIGALGTTQVTLGAVIVVFVLFEIKHLLADYILQTDWMAQGKQRRAGWAPPLFVHAGMHGFGTALVALAVNPAFVWLAFVDFFVHALIDFMKARIGLATGLTPANARFWWLFGADQQLHALTHLALAVVLLAG